MKDGTEKVGDSRGSHQAPLEYWETCDARQGGIIEEINEKGLCFHSLDDMYMGSEFRLRVFFFRGYEFDGFQVLAKIVGKDSFSQEGWEVYEYQLEFIRMSEQDHLKLRDLLRIRQVRNIRS